MLPWKHTVRDLRRRAAAATLFVSVALTFACTSATAADDASGSGGGSGGVPALDMSTVLLAPVPPRPVRGGTMLLSADQRTAVAADPDRDAVWWTDVASAAGPVNKVALTPGDEP